MKKVEIIPASVLMKIISEVSAYYESLGWPKGYGGVEACEKIKERIEGLRSKNNGAD